MEMRHMRAAAARRAAISWALAMAIGAAGGSAAAVAIDGGAAHGAAHGVARARAVAAAPRYGSGGKAADAGISRWETSAPEFEELDIPLDADVQEFSFWLCEAYGIDYTLALAVMEAESGYDPGCVSETGDYGIMQINRANFPELSERLGIRDFCDPYEGINAGLYIMRGLFERHGDTNKVLMAYNMGEAGASALWERGVYESRYSRKVLECQERLKAMARAAGRGKGWKGRGRSARRQAP